MYWGWGVRQDGGLLLECVGGGHGGHSQGSHRRNGGNSQHWKEAFPVLGSDAVESGFCGSPMCFFIPSLHPLSPFNREPVQLQLRIRQKG